MYRHLLRAAVPLGVMVVLTGCIDNKYDLSDLDKTAEFKVKDLVLPVNLDVIKLDNIIKIDDDSKIKVVTLNGQRIYAVQESGDFHSDPITVGAFSAAAPTIENSRAIFDKGASSTRAAVTDSYTFSSFNPQKFSYQASDIDESILSISTLSIKPLLININFSASGLGNATTMKFSTLSMNFLKGLTLSDLPSNFSYDPVSGRLDITDLDCPDHAADILLTATAVNFEQVGTAIENHTMKYDSEIQVVDGVLLTTTENPTPADRPGQIEFEVATTVAPLEATAFSGEMEYVLEGEGLSIDPVDLSDVPDFLAGEETNIRLANPQIYLSLNNPLSSSRLDITSGLLLTSNRASGSKEFPLNPGEKIEIGYSASNNIYNFVLSPSMPSEPLAAYKENLKHVGYSSLGNVLSGNGLPTTIDIALVDPEVPRQTVTDFQLDVEYDGVYGQYDFFAPLALVSGENGSVIVYTKTDDGWSDDDLDKLTINRLVVDADASSDLPLGAEITVVPVDKQGNTYPGLETTKATISAKAQDQPIHIEISGTITKLDGVRIEAVVRPGSDQTLSPDQTITLKNVKATVSGNYTTEL